SPAIDDAISSVAQWPELDADGKARADDPGTPNTGSGPVLFADRGAYEFNGASSGSPPVARLTVSPSSGNPPLPVTANASTSTDPDNNISSYTFNWGDGATTGPQAGATATHTFGPGNFTVQVTVTDATSLFSTASAPVSVTDRLPVVVAPVNA